MIWILARGALAAEPLEDVDFYAFGGDPAEGVTPLVNATVFHEACARIAGCTGPPAEGETCDDPVACACVFAGALEASLATGAPRPAELESWPAPDEVTAAVTSPCAPDENEKARLVGRAGTGEAAPGASNLLLGATDFFLERAGQELAAWSVERFLSRVCREDDGVALRSTALLPETCAWVDDVRRAATAGTELQLALPALESDARTLVRHVSEESIRASLLGPRPEGEVAVRDGLAAVAVLARVGEQVSLGVQVSDAYGSWARTRAPETQVATAEGALQSAALVFETDPIATSLYAGSVFAAGLPPTTAAVLEPSDGLVLVPTVASDGEIVTIARVNFEAVTLPVETPGVDELVTAWRLLEPAWIESRTTWLLDRRARLGDLDGRRLLSRLAPSAEPLVRVGLLLSSPRTPSRPGPWLTRATDSASALAVMDGPRVANQIVGLVTALPDPESAEKLAATDGAGASRKLRICKNDPPPADRDIQVELASVLRASRLAFFAWAATDPSSAQAAIEQAVRPVDGYRYKRDGDRAGYFTLQGYVGLGGGVEVLLPAGGRLGPAAGTVAPVIAVGPEFGLRITRSRPHPTNIGLQAQILDLGTLAAWRIDAGDTEAVPDLQLSHVFAPGANLSFGVPSAPLAIIAGVAVVPALRDVRPDTSLEVSDVTAMRVGLSFVVDIPLLF